jgi:hypothetical protein
MTPVSCQKVRELQVPLIFCGGRLDCTTCEIHRLMLIGRKRLTGIGHCDG